MRKAAWAAVFVALGMLAGCRHAGPGTEGTVQRFGGVIGLKAEKLETYKELHANVWPGVLEKIRECNIRNYSICLPRLDDGNYCLFSHFDHTGKDFKGDMARMAADPLTQKWWRETDPCQFAVKHRAEGEWWANMEEVFHTP